jgi:hypothetical protein
MSAVVYMIMNLLVLLKARNFLISGIIKIITKKCNFDMLATRSGGRGVL